MNDMRIMQFVLVPKSNSHIDCHKMLILLALIAMPSIVSCQMIETAVEISGNNKTIIERPYCFRFTWLGPKYNEESHFRNATCGDVIKGDKTVPCTHPLVVTS